MPPSEALSWWRHRLDVRPEHSTHSEPMWAVGPVSTACQSRTSVGCGGPAGGTLSPECKEELGAWSPLAARGCTRPLALLASLRWVELRVLATRPWSRVVNRSPWPTNVTFRKLPS